MNTRTSIFYLLTIILCLGATAMSHGETVVSISPSPVVSPAAGSTLKVNIQISGASGVAGYECSVEFDSSALTYVSAANATYLPEGAFAPAPQVSDNRVTLTASAGSAATESSGTLATVTFRVAAAEASTLRLQNVSLSNAAWRKLKVSTANGQVTKRSGPAWDVNLDGKVNNDDLALVSQNLGSSSPANPRVDVNGDGQVNVTDLALVSRNLSEEVPDEGDRTGDAGGAAEGAADSDASGAAAEAVADRDTGGAAAEAITDIPVPEGMVLIPAGQFQMGSNDAGAPNNDEQPVHTVHLNAFFMDTHEVTNAQFKAFVDANPAWQKGQIDARFHNGDYLSSWQGNNHPAGKADHPVTHVSWYAAMAYAQWAGKRLPTEAEWEYAARGGLAGNKYPSGNTLTPNDANFSRNVGDTTAVGSYPANGYGLHDMVGNVWEWCLDAYDAGFYAASRDSRNPISGAQTIQGILGNFTNVASNSSRVLRGGSWYNSAQFLRVSYRNRSAPTRSPGFNGFRCVRGATP